MSYTYVVMLTNFEKPEEKVTVEATSIQVAGGWWNSDGSITPEPKTQSGEVRG